MADSPSIRQSPVTLLISTLALVALLSWWVGWALVLVIAAILVMVLLHEFGHFICAKRSGLLVTDFFVGFGPLLWAKTFGETRYGIRALPLGGYVKVPGMTWADDVDPAIEGRTYRAASYPRKVVFASAGSMMHVLIALVLAWASLSFIGQPTTSDVGIVAFTPWVGHQENAAQLAGLKKGDQIVDVAGKKVTSTDQLVRIVHRSTNRRISIVVLRDGRLVHLHAVPVNGTTIKEDGKRMPAGGYLGIEVGEMTVRSSWLGAVPSSFHEVGSTIDASLHAIVHVFSPGEFASLFHQVASPAAANNPVNQENRPESIVGVVRVAVQSTRAGNATLLAVLITINIFVGVLNMFPMLPLDGGYVAIATYERLRSRAKQRYRADINRLVPVIYAFMAVLLVLFFCTLYLDIAHPIANPFG